MTAQADQMHAMALTAALPVRLKLLSVAGHEPFVTTYEPACPSADPEPQHRLRKHHIVQQSQRSRCGSCFGLGTMRWCTLLRALKTTTAQYRHASRSEDPDGTV